MPTQIARPRYLVLGAVCSMFPDIDVLGFHVGIQYADMWGHRGLTHSLLFAAVLSIVLVMVLFRKSSAKFKALLFLYLFFCISSHGVLDAMTNGGLGVAFFSPFDPTRYFLPFRPIAVSPIGAQRFFTQRGLHVIFNEVLWIWLPSLLFLSAALLTKRKRSFIAIRFEHTK